MDAKRRLDHFLFEEYRASERSLGVYRILYAAFALLVIAPGERFGAVAALPDGLFAPPPGPVRWLVGAFPPASFFVGLHWLVNASLVALLLGLRTRWAALAAGLSMMTGFGLLYSVGKVNHNILLLIVPLVLSPSAWGNCYSLDGLAGRRGPHRAWPLSLLALFVGFGMCTAGIQKWQWLDPTSFGVRGRLVREFVVRGHTDFLAPALMRFDSRYFWEAMDWTVVAFELGFLPAVLSRRWFRGFAVAAMFFHLGVLLTLNISFVDNYVVYAAFAPWAILLPPVRSGARTGARLGRGLQRPQVAWPLLLAGTGLITLAGSPLGWLSTPAGLRSGLRPAELLSLALGLLMIVALLLRSWPQRWVRSAAATPPRGSG